MATPARWSGTAEHPVLEAVDLDLDVLRSPSGRVWVDDEDEFAAHRVRLGYPDELVADALAGCAEVQQALTDRTAPFDDTHLGWLERLR